MSFTPPGGPNHPRFDRSLKWLLSRAPNDVLALIAPGFTWSPVDLAQRAGRYAVLRGSIARRNPVLHDVVIELMKDPDVAKYWIDLAHAKGIDPERAAAYAQGRDEGIREAIRVLLEERFGRLDAEFLAALDRTQGTALTEILLHSQKDNLEQVRERLDATGVA